MNIPNKLSLLRCILVPVIYVFYLLPYNWGKFVAFGLFILSAYTDHLDGKIARKYNMITDLGKLLDPLADKLLYCGCMMLIVADKTIVAPYGVIGLFIIFARDTLVNGIRQVAATKGKVLAAVLSSKLKAIFVYIFIPAFMLYAGLKGIDNPSNALVSTTNVIHIIADVFFLISTCITSWSAIDFSIKNKFAFKQ